QFGGKEPKKRAAAVKLLLAANRLTDAGKFLPPIETAIQEKDTRALDLHARYLTATAKQNQETNSTEMLRKAWDLNQSVMAATNSLPKEREQSLACALELMTLLSKDSTTNWLRQTFQSKPEQGLSILAALGSQLTQNASSRDIVIRSKG